MQRLPTPHSLEIYRERETALAGKMELLRKEDAVQGVLLINFAQARINLLQQRILIDGKNAPVDPLAFEADIERFSRAVQALETYRKFYGSFHRQMTSLDSGMYGRIAAQRIDLAELDQQDIAGGDTTRQHLIVKMRSDLLFMEQKLLKTNGFIGDGNIFNILEGASALQSRLKMAMFGGLVLLIPMLIMVLHPTKLTALLTTVTCVLFVAVALSFGMRNAEDKDVLAATAAYAAVLVVFVGINTTTSELSNGVIGAITGGVCGGFLLIFMVYYRIQYSLQRGFGRFVEFVLPYLKKLRF